MPPACAATFGGDPTGATDVGAALAAFLTHHTGNVCLAPGATYRVTQILANGVHDLVLDGRAATIQSGDTLVTGIFRLRSARNVTIRNLMVRGTSSLFAQATQWGSAFHLDGGADITLDHVRVRNVRGDGIYVSYSAGNTTPATGVRIISPDVSQVGRNGIAPVAGQVTITGGTISHTGLFGVNFECNNNVGCASIVGSVSRTYIHAVSEQWTGAIRYAVAAGGVTTAAKRSISVLGIISDGAFLTIRNTTTVTVKDVVSGMAATAWFPGCGTVTFTNNLRVTRAP